MLRRAFSILAFAGFVASLVVHLTTFFGVDPGKHSRWVWVLHAGIFVVFIPMAFAQGFKPKKEFRGQFFAAMPRWARYTIRAFFAYAIINFILFFSLSYGGTPGVLDGKYVLHNHGKIVRELSEEEYDLQRARVVRGFSGHWMVFYLIPAFYFWYPKTEPGLA